MPTTVSKRVADSDKEPSSLFLKNKTQHLCMRCGWIDSDKWLEGEHNMHNLDWNDRMEEKKRFMQQ